MRKSNERLVRGSAVNLAFVLIIVTHKQTGIQEYNLSKS